MKKRTYIAPKTILLEMEAVAQVMSESEQSPWADAKRHSTSGNDEIVWEEDDPWETVAKHKDLWD